MSRHLILLAGLAACASAGDPGGSCTSPRYRGGPLHPPPEATAFGPVPVPRPLTSADRLALDAALDSARRASGATTLTAAVARRGGDGWSPAGSADEPLHYWASVGKTFTAVVVLQLAAEGRLTLDAPVSRWVRGVPNGDRVTLESLLNHTSGLYSANEDPEVRRAGGAMTLDQELAVLRRHGPLFCPGEAWRYSNSGYTLLGEVIRQVDGRPYADAVAARIIAPLALRRLRVLRPGESPADIAPLRPDSGDWVMTPSAAGAAGGVVAPADEMLAFWQALLDGRLLPSDDARDMFTRLFPMFDAGMYYGRGVMLMEAAGQVYLGHAGGVPGGSAIVLYSPVNGSLAAVALTGRGSSAAAAHLLLHAVVAQTLGDIPGPEDAATPAHLNHP